MDTSSLTKEEKIYNGEKIISLTRGYGNTGQIPAKKKKNENRLLSNTIHKNKFKMD